MYLPYTVSNPCNLNYVARHERIFICHIPGLEHRLLHHQAGSRCAKNIYTIVLSWGKYSYMCLPMGIADSPDIFQEKILNLIESLDYLCLPRVHMMVTYLSCIWCYVDCNMQAFA